MPEPPEFKAHGDPESWLLNLVSVHPLRVGYAERALRGLVDKPSEFIERIVRDGKVRIVEFEGEEFLVRAY